MNLGWNIKPQVSAYESDTATWRFIKLTVRLLLLLHKMPGAVEALPET